MGVVVLESDLEFDLSECRTQVSSDPSNTTPISPPTAFEKLVEKSIADTYGLDEVPLLLSGGLIEEFTNGASHAGYADFAGHFCKMEDKEKQDQIFASRVQIATSVPFLHSSSQMSSDRVRRRSPSLLEWIASLP